MDIDAKKTDTPDAEADKDDKKNATAVSEKIAEGERCAYESCRDHGGERGDGHDVAKILHKDEHFARCVEGDLRGQNDGEKDGENTKDEGEARMVNLPVRGRAGPAHAHAVSAEFEPAPLHLPPSLNSSSALVALSS